MTAASPETIEVLHVVGGAAREGGVMAFTQTIAESPNPGLIQRIWKHRDFQRPKDTENLWICEGRCRATDRGIAHDVIGALFDLPALLAWVRKHPRVVLHAHSRMGNIAAALVARMTGASLIAHAHATPRHTGLYHRLWRFSRATPVFNSWRTCRHFGCDPKSATIVPPPISWPDSPARSLPDDRIQRYAASSSFIALKNLHLIVAAFDRICSSGQKAELQLFGRSSKPSDADYQARIIAAAQANPAIQIMDWQNNWANMLTGSDVFVHAATEESFGIVILEAFARGCHVIVPPGTFLEDIHTSPLSGVIIADPLNPVALADAMQQASENVRRISADSLWQSRLQFAERFATGHRQAQLLQLYQQALSDHRR